MPSCAKRTRRSLRQPASIRSRSGTRGRTTRSGPTRGGVGSWRDASTDRIVVHPSWIEPTDLRGEDIVIMLDPGMAFGTAEHGTTRGCLRLLDGAVRDGDRVLDVGAGSGILSIAAAHLAAASVVAIEGDSLACEALAENLDRNGVSERVEVVEAWATHASLVARRPVSGIIANIEAGLLKPLFDSFFEALELLAG